MIPANTSSLPRYKYQAADTSLLLLVARSAIQRGCQRRCRITDVASDVTRSKGAEGAIYFPGIATSLLKSSMVTLSCSGCTHLFLLKVISGFTWKHIKLQTFFKPREAEVKRPTYSTNAALPFHQGSTLAPFLHADQQVTISKTPC